jgi:hypothetical protein
MRRQRAGSHPGREVGEPVSIETGQGVDDAVAVWQPDIVRLPLAASVLVAVIAALNRGYNVTSIRPTASDIPSRETIDNVGTIALQASDVASSGVAFRQRCTSFFVHLDKPAAVS